MKVNESKTQDKQLHINHVFDAPIELVFQAWTNPDLLPKWFAPEGCTIIFKQLDIRKGGKFHSCIDNPDYGPCWCTGTYLEIVELEKIVYSIAMSDEKGNVPASHDKDENWPDETTVTVTFAESAGKTILTLQQNVSEALAKNTGAYPSWIQMLARLEELIKL